MQSTCLLDRSSGNMLGQLSTYFRQPHRLSERDIRLTDLLAAQAADAIASRLTEKRLRDSEERFRQFAEYSADVLWIADTETRKLEYLSPAHTRIWGLPPGSISTLESWSRTIHPDDQVGALVALQRVERGEVVVQEYRILRPDGGVRWIRDTAFPIAKELGRVPRIGGISQDITKHDGSRAYVVDVDNVSRRSLTLLLQEEGYDCREFATAAAFLNVAPALLPGCVVLDIRAAGIAGLSILPELRARHIQLPVIVIGMGGEVHTAVSAMKAGAVEFLQAPYDEFTLRTAVASALVGLREVEEEDQTVKRARQQLGEMSARERQVLEGLLAGETNKMIGRKLDVSPRTVEAHRAHLMERFGARTLPELVLLLTSAGVRPQRNETSAD